MSYTCTGSDELQVSDNGSGGVTFTTCGDSCYLLYSDTVQFTSTGGEALDTGGSSAIHVLSSEQLQGYGMSSLTDTPTATRYYVLASMGSASDSYITKANANATVVPSSASTITTSSVTATLSGSAVSIDYEIASFTNDDMDYYALYYGDSSECPTSMDLMGGGETECTFVQRMDSESGTVTNVAAPSTGVKRWYFIINIAPSPGSVVASASITGQAQATQLTAPTATATSTSSSITLTFESVTNAESYLLRYGTTNPPTGDGSAYTSGTAITSLTASTTYYLQLKSVGNGSTYSNSDWGSVITQATSAETTPDTTSPVVTLSGESSISLANGASWSDPGATATDDTDGSLMPTITYSLGGVSKASFDSTQAGTWTITYSATDAANNTGTATRTVTVAEALTITDFTAEVVTGGVQCQFTAPAGISVNSTVQWQRTTTDPDSGTPTWTTVATTDLNGNAVTE